jgi:hypothetical protein
MTKPCKERVDKGVRRSVYISVTCPCGKEFEVRKSRLEAGRGKRCSKECTRLYAVRPSGLTYEKHKDNPTSFKPGEHRSTDTEFKPGQKPWNDGLELTDRDAWLRNQFPHYAALHQKLSRERGRAALYSCELADSTCKGPVQWSNISQQYLGIEDFRPLCLSHHLRYDRSN